MCATETRKRAASNLVAWLKRSAAKSVAGAFQLWRMKAKMAVRNLPLGTEGDIWRGLTCVVVPQIVLF